MGSRKTFDDALTPEVEKFLKDGATKRKLPKETKFKVKTSPPSRQVSQAALVTVPTAAGIGNNGTINTRIDPRITAALLRVMLERKLARETPCTQKGIVAEALLEWLNKREIWL